jgi:poly-gamma-glutamate capsule biosynthesis protein CapA/YwtB (metallophosphatase superfamily)
VPTPPTPSAAGRVRHAIGAFLGVLTAIAVAAGAIYTFGPWSAEPIPQTGAPRPAVKAAKVPGRTISVLGAGDILVHPELWDQARRDGNGRRDFRAMFAPSAPTISAADLALCHLETVVAPPNGPFTGFPRFSVPQEIVPAIKSAGYDGCSTSSNHSLDQGYGGIKRTLEAMDRAGLGHTGTYRTAEEAERPKIYNVKGVKVGHLSYSKNFNGLKHPVGQEWSANQIDPAKIAADAQLARDAGAEIVIVSLHWGTEYEHEPDVDQQTWARAVAQINDVDLVFGHHAHVVQPVERINDKWIVYGMGNQIARHAEPINPNRDGTMMRVTFTTTDVPGRWKVGAIEAFPTFVDLNPDIRLIDLERALASPSLPPSRRRIYEESVSRIQSHLLTRGADRDGLVVHGVGGR